MSSFYQPCYGCGEPFVGSFCPRCNPNSFDNSQYFSDYSSQPRYETIICELCGNDAHFGYDCSPHVPFDYNPNPCFDQNFDNNFPLTSPQYLCYENYGGLHYDYQCQPINEIDYEPNPSYDSSGFDQPQPPQDSVDHQGILQALRKIQEELEEIKQYRRKKKEDMSIEEIMSEKQLIDDEIKDISNGLSYKRFRGEKIDDEYERDCEIKIEQLLQDYNGLDTEMRKKERVLMEEKSLAVLQHIKSICDDDEDDSIPLRDIIARYSPSIATTSYPPDLPIEEPINSLSMDDEHLSTSVENLVPIPSEFEGISNDTCDVPVCDDSSTFDALSNHFEILSDSNDDDTSSDDDDFEDIEYVSLEEVNDVDQEKEEIDLEDIFQIQDVNLREKLLNINRLISNIESLKDNPTPDCVLNSPFSFPIPVVDSDSFFEKSDTSLSHLDNSLPEFETFRDHTKETRSGSTTTHANYSLPEYDLFLFEIEPDQERLISIDNSNDSLLEIPEFESFYFDDPSFPRPLP
ncbi:hypothetical protein Tco_0556659, partial [Tanacetum coccineum]